MITSVFEYFSQMTWTSILSLVRIFPLIIPLMIVLSPQGVRNYLLDALCKFAYSSSLVFPSPCFNSFFQRRILPTFPYWKESVSFLHAPSSQNLLHVSCWFPCLALIFTSKHILFLNEIPFPAPQ